jgi:glycosyltransferase involved in cell wall biosynthesis
MESRPVVPEVIDVILPVLDEAEALTWLLPRMPDAYRAIVVDNGSTDGSASIAADLGAIVITERQRGFGSACWAGLSAANSDLVAFMDADASLDPRDLPRLIAAFSDRRADLVLGARQADRGAWPLHARIANRYLANRVSRRFDTEPLRDIGPMRAARRIDLLALGMTDRRSGWPLEMVLRAARSDWRITEIPVRYRSRAGRSKVTGTVRGTITAVRDQHQMLRSLA